MSVSDEINNEINKATFAREQNPNVERTICNRNKNAFLGGVCLGVSVYGGCAPPSPVDRMTDACENINFPPVR